MCRRPHGLGPVYAAPSCQQIDWRDRDFWPCWLAQHRSDHCTASSARGLSDAPGVEPAKEVVIIRMRYGPAWRKSGDLTWGRGAMLSAQSCMEWLRKIGLVSSAQECDELVRSCADTGGEFSVLEF